ncbi:ROK family protein [Deinococcus roseus]|uniref:Glucokinase n=1 Tax=Deinococcus roseus TaxID=392414 RepID=A0ABQ2DID1_9DEIO|nr:ROK family protein [Deinococcus roseus]GGJ59123.1 glucokinase [Deinococcus roseus]
MSFALTLDIGGSHITAAVIDTANRMLLEKSLVRKAIHESAPAQHLLDTWALAAHQAHRLAGAPRLSHIGMAIPDPFDHQQGISLHQHKFSHLHGLNVTAALQERWTSSALLNVPVLYGNDADLYVLGEWWGGAAQGHQRVMGITLGTGLGAGFLENGQMLTQDSRIPPGGELWSVPHKGSIAEDYASGRSIVKHHSLMTGRPWDVLQISTAARTGDRAAQQVLLQFGDELGQILTPWISSFQPGVLVLGGNISRAADCFMENLKKHLPETQIQPSVLLEQASLLGAAAISSPSAQPHRAI